MISPTPISTQYWARWLAGFEGLASSWLFKLRKWKDEHCCNNHSEDIRKGRAKRTKEWGALTTLWPSCPSTRTVLSTWWATSSLHSSIWKKKQFYSTQLHAPSVAQSSTIWEDSAISPTPTTSRVWNNLMVFSTNKNLSSGTVWFLWSTCVISFYVYFAETCSLS